MSITTKKIKLRVLVVDDNADHANTLSMLLKSSGHDSHVCVDASACMKAVERWHPDVVLLDLKMPSKSGYDIAKEISEIFGDPELRHVRLVAISGYGQPLDRIQTKLCGFDQHFVKPINFAALETFLDSIQDQEDD